jgi:hypothetical protein
MEGLEWVKTLAEPRFVALLLEGTAFYKCVQIVGDSLADGRRLTRADGFSFYRRTISML